jgi:putative transposase
MPRRARTYLPGFPYHVVQRGNNRETCFLEPEDYRFYLGLWRELSRRYGVSVHAYCLMTNHFHFLVTPETEGAISNTLKVVGSRYAQYINGKYRRTGTLWEGRHRSSLVQSDRYLLTCYRYIELNPVRAGMVAGPEEHRWSSHGANAGLERSWLTPHDEYLRLGRTPEARAVAYRALFREPLSGSDLHRIRVAAHYCQPVGDEHFRRELEATYGIRLGQMRRGRPRRSGGNAVLS